MVVDLDGGILTIGLNKENFHNLIFYIKKTEFIIGKKGYILIYPLIIKLILLL